jgi:hypothetical protein
LKGSSSSARAHAPRAASPPAHEVFVAWQVGSQNRAAFPVAADELVRDAMPSGGKTHLMAWHVPEEDAKVPTVCHSLDQALDYLDKDRAFLTKGGVFTDSYIDAYIELKMQEVTRFRMTTHPLEFDMYYSL